MPLEVVTFWHLLSASQPASLSLDPAVGSARPELRCLQGVLLLLGGLITAIK